MRYLSLVFFFFVLCSCQEDEGDCPDRSDNFHFNLISKSTNQNLAFGPDAVYKPNEIRVFALTDNGEKLYYECRVVDSETGKHFLTSLDGKLNPDGVNQMYLKLNSTDIDTIYFNFPVTSKAEGCNYYQLRDLSYNRTSVCSDCYSGIPAYNFY